MKEIEPKDAPEVSGGAIDPGPPGGGLATPPYVPPPPLDPSGTTKLS